jgi:lysozyme
MRVFLSDVSGHQRNVDWDAYRKAGRAGALCKATQHTTFVSDQFRSQRAGMARVGLVFRGIYHFAGHQADPERNKPASLLNASDEADHFIATVGDLDGEVPALDLEVAPPGMGPKDLADWALIWLERVESRYGMVPLLYTSEDFLNSKVKKDQRLRKFTLWVAAYRANDGKVPSKEPDTPWPWTFWQYTSKAQVPGISTLADDNVFEGAVAGLADLSERIRGADDLTADERAALLTVAARVVDLHAAMSQEKTGSFPQPRLDNMERRVAELQARVRELANQIA